MGYTVNTEDKTTLLWDDNPTVGAVTSAVITNGVVTEFVVEDSNFVSLIHSTDAVYLEHLRDTITDLLANLTP